MTRSAARPIGKSRVNPAREYQAFEQLDGTHPLQTAVPDSCILYNVRLLPHGKVAYFNFSLAKEMGLIPQHHPEQLNRKLEEKILETFCLRIINEWDQAHNVVYPKGAVKPKQYMATRYLQLQHADKAGRTSGDGRCIWNGVVRHNGKTWDVSSRGTGVTALAPGVVQAGRPLRSGNTEHGYGCGMAEIDELYAAAIMAEIMHNQGIRTERVLAIVDLGRGMGIGVRAGTNLLRPAHLFALLRQEKAAALRAAVDYLIHRQNQNGVWSFSPHSRRRFTQMLTRLTHDFARFAAQLDREYIFAWLDWDGDNMLVDSGIIDYGSVRQFGLRHDQYRYDDVERFSTNLNEQRSKARLIVQGYAQMVAYLETGMRRPLREFRSHPALRDFDALFDYHLWDHFLYQMGLTQGQRVKLLNQNRPLVKQLYEEFSFLERKKTYRQMQRVADGVNRPAIFNMRQVLSELPSHFLAHAHEFSRYEIPCRELLDLMLSDYASGRDKKLTKRLDARLRRFQQTYKRVLATSATTAAMPSFLLGLSERSALINRRDRITGNALIHVVDEILKARRRGLSDSAIQDVMTAIIADQSPRPGRPAPDTTLNPAPVAELFSQVLSLVDDHKEEI